MDTNKQTDRVKKSTPVPPAQLWIGQHQDLVHQATAYLQNIFCKNKVCNTCTTCMQVRNQQYHATIWLYPEKQYTLDQIDTILQTISFALDTHENVFFVIQKADFLPSVCANRLLKSIEEPPTGYFFLLLAERKEQILPTIHSRCITKIFYTKDSAELYPELFACFSSTKKQSPLDFMKLLQASDINERESIELLDLLTKHWIKKYKHAAKKSDVDAQNNIKQIIDVLKKHIIIPPMPGSSKLFWKNLFLHMHM